MSLQKREKDGSIIGEAEITTKGTPFSTKGIGFRCKGHLISYVWRDESCICLLFHWSACFTQKGSLLRAADASGEEVEKIPHFFIDKQWWRNGRQRGSDSGCGIWWKRSCFPLAFSQPRKGHAWIPGVVLVRAQQKCMRGTIKSLECLDGVRCFLWKVSELEGWNLGFGSKYVIGWIMARCIQGFFGAQKNVYGTEVKLTT